MARFDIGDYILYGINGSCEIVDIGELPFGGEDKIYYSLKPVSDGRSTIYLPVIKEDEIIRAVISKDEADGIVDKFKSIKPSKTEINRDTCEPIIKSGDNSKIVALIKQLRKLRVENRKSHKGLNIQEEKLLRQAETVLYSELATAYDLAIDEIVAKYSEYLD